MKPNSLIVSISIVVLIIAGAACKSFDPVYVAGEKAVEKFHAQLNAEKYDEIYRQSSDTFQYTTRKEDAFKLFADVRKKLGVSGKSSEQAWTVKTIPNGTMISMTYETEFTNDKATEFFTFLLDGGEALLVEYRINSMNLNAE